jgi:hypothetical protein
MRKAANSSEPPVSLINHVRRWIARIIAPPAENPAAGPDPQKRRDNPTQPGPAPREYDPFALKDDFGSPGQLKSSGASELPSIFVGEFDLPPNERPIKPQPEVPSREPDTQRATDPTPRLAREIFDRARSQDEFIAVVEHWTLMLNQGLGEAMGTHKGSQLLVFDALGVALAALLALHLPKTYGADLLALLLEDLDAGRSILAEGPRMTTESNYELGRLFALALETADRQADLRGASHRAKIEGFHVGLIEYGASHYSKDVLSRILDDLERARR